MELLNATPFAAGYTMGLEPSGREYLVVVVKGTYSLTESGNPVELAPDQVPLVYADTFFDEPGFSSPIYESDFALTKQKCDVLIVGNVYPPNGEPSSRCDVGIRIGEWQKKFVAVGDRYWDESLTGTKSSDPAPFETMPITYETAFGGVDDLDPDTSKHDAYTDNPVGRGWYYDPTPSRIGGRPLPNTEEVDRPVSSPTGSYRPMALGVVGRNWTPRAGYAGTYDDAWFEDVFPFLPADFDDAYFQAAPADQQIPYPTGGEEVFLLNLTPTGIYRFSLPRQNVPVVYFHSDGGRHETKGVIDTVLIEPEKLRLSITWRAALPIKRNIFEIAQVLVGEKPRGWWRARELGKTYYPSLGDLVRANREEAAEE